MTTKWSESASACRACQDVFLCASWITNLECCKETILNVLVTRIFDIFMTIQVQHSYTSSQPMVEALLHLSPPPIVGFYFNSCSHAFRYRTRMKEEKSHLVENRTRYLILHSGSFFFSFFCFYPLPGTFVPRPRFFSFFFLEIFCALFFDCRSIFVRNVGVTQNPNLVKTERRRRRRSTNLRNPVTSKIRLRCNRSL